MSIVAGVDFGTLSVRASLFDSVRGRLGSGTADYPLNRRKSDPDHATQSHDDHMAALGKALRAALNAANVDGSAVEAMAVDTTGSSVIPVDAQLQPLGDYYLWCDHRAWKEAAEITSAARAASPPAIDWCGGTYSSEWGFSKLLHWLRNNPGQRDRFATAQKHCDMAAATLTGVRDVDEIARSICAMGHKWMWNPLWGGFPPEEFFTSIDPLFKGIRGRIAGRLRRRSNSREGSRRSGLRGWGCGRAFRFRLAPSTRIGTRSAPGRGWAMWSMWWERPAASWP